MPRKHLTQAKRFREGYIILTRSFDFGDLPTPLHKLSIFYAYSDRPMIERILTEEALETLREIDADDTRYQQSYRLPTSHRGVVAAEQVYDDVYQGEVCQIYVHGKMVRLFPGEYTVLTQERVYFILESGGYHVVTEPQLAGLKEFLVKTHYFRSRGVDLATAERMITPQFKGLVYYKPYRRLLTIFERQPIPDQFYADVEGDQ